MAPPKESNLTNKISNNAVVLVQRIELDLLQSGLILLDAVVVCALAVPGPTPVVGGVRAKIRQEAVSPASFNLVLTGLEQGVSHLGIVDFVGRLISITTSILAKSDVHTNMFEWSADRGFHGLQWIQLEGHDRHRRNQVLVIRYTDVTELALSLEQLVSITEVGVTDIWSSNTDAGYWLGNNGIIGGSALKGKESSNSCTKAVAGNVELVSRVALERQKDRFLKNGLIFVEKDPLRALDATRRRRKQAIVNLAVDLYLLRLVRPSCGFSEEEKSKD